MNRVHLTFSCEGAKLAGTLDEAEGAAGLLIVTGGNEVRAGAFAGQAQIARRIAQAGYPVFRFDRRGVGDSEGENCGFRASGPDIAAAPSAFRDHAPHCERIVGFGNCDGASALMLNAGSGFDALMLSNPWTFDDDDGGGTPPEAVRAHYRQRLSDPAALKRLLSGKVSISGLAGSLRSALSPPPPPPSLVRDIAEGIEQFAGPISFLVAERDRTAQAFLSTWDKQDNRIAHCPGASHAYVEPDAQEWLYQRLLEMLARTGG